MESITGRWYGDKDPPTTCFVERKTHRESWKGEESVKERFTLPEDKMVPYLEGEYTLQQAQHDLKAKARPCFLHFQTICRLISKPAACRREKWLMICRL